MVFIKKIYEIKDVLTHHNDFHGIQFQHFNVKERNVIMALCYKAMNQDSNLLEFTVDEIKKMSNYKPRKAGDSVYKLMHETYEKIKKASIIIKKDNGIKSFVLFTVFETFEDKGIINIRVNDEYKYLLNNLSNNFTSQNLLEYAQLESNYSQLTYSLLKRWESEKFKKISIEEYKDLLGVPNKYSTSDFNKRVLLLVMKELAPFFHGLALKKITTGKKVTHLEFSWKKIKKEMNTDEVVIVFSEELQKAFEYASNNRYIKSFMTLDNKNKLTNEFEEKALIRGLNHAKVEIKEEFKHLSYLIKCIDDFIKKPTITEKTAKKESVSTGKEYIQTQIKTKISEEQYAELIHNFEKKILKTMSDSTKEKTMEAYIEKLDNEYDIIDDFDNLDEQNNLDVVPSGDVPEEKNTYIITEEEKAAFDEFKKFRETLKSATPKEVKSVMLDNRLNFEEIGLVSYLCFSDIPVDELLSKKGLPLVGGALKMRLQKIANEQKTCINYNNEVIEPR